MEDIITIAIGLLGQFSFLVKNPKIKPAVENLSKWVGNLFSNKTEREKLQKVENKEFDDELITSLIQTIKTELTGNNKITELEKLVKNIREKAEQENLTKVINANITTITGNKNIALSGIQTSGGDINININ